MNVSKSAENLFNESSRNLSTMTTMLNNAASNVDAITLESRNLVSDISHGKGTVGALLYDRSLYDSLESLTGTLTEAASSAGFAAREFGINMLAATGLFALTSLIIIVRLPEPRRGAKVVIN